MQAFLLIQLSASATYEQPLLAELKQLLPDLAVLDIDGRSDELLQHYALRLLREADRAVVCIKADEAAAGLINVMPLLEELLQSSQNRLVLLLGQYPRLLRIFESRPQLQYKQVAEQDVLSEVRGALD
ncbi:hypothetical protein CLV24_11761 [Pontibacter ummariensis]|uniref:SpoIIAA-like n=1 Tax=Pontibacter ummariensis TaxID=1610492 RepID=A0A239IHQ2_9BACT|nr:hypothetical protein [Pontibacter ummariensis]PRY09856.1 hypothetical protein CLV24_11761 [Pontibacter ummariensis]SNS93137.1 hypothetical protein SAMN06296052_11761 [Pontibacter ummariensis]